MISRRARVGLMVAAAALVAGCSTTSDTAGPAPATAAPDVQITEPEPALPPDSLPVVQVTSPPGAPQVSASTTTAPPPAASTTDAPPPPPTSPTIAPGDGNIDNGNNGNDNNGNGHDNNGNGNGNGNNGNGNGNGNGNNGNGNGNGNGNNGNGNGNNGNGNGNNGNGNGNGNGSPGTGTCALTGAPDAGSGTVTVVRDGALFELHDGAEACLRELRSNEAGRPMWSPDGQRVLLNPSVMLDANGVHETGYFPENAKISWSMPTGKSIIAPAVRDGKLIKRNAGDPGSRKDITFVLPTTAAAYHPAGMHIFGAGDGPEGPGLYIASNLGTEPRMIAQLLDPGSSIPEIGAVLQGDAVFFIHDHGDGLFHLHHLTLPGLQLADSMTEQRPIARLTVGPAGSAAVRLGDCSGNTVTAVASSDGGQVSIDQGPLAGLSTEPIGWLSGDKLVVAARSGGCDGPVDVYVVDTGNPAGAERVAEQVTSAAVRYTVGGVGQLPGDIVAQAPG